MKKQFALFTLLFISLLRLSAQGDKRGEVNNNVNNTDSIAESKFMTKKEVIELIKLIAVIPVIIKK